MFKTSQVLLTLGVLVLLIAVGVGAFMYGRSAGLTEQVTIRTDFIQQRASAPSGTGTTGNPASGDAARNPQGRQLAAGVVKSVQGNVIQITQRDGSTTSYTLDDKTLVTKTTSGTLADIQPGWTIIVSEQTGAGGTTQRVLLTQEAGPGQGQGTRGGQGQPTPKP
ncbi:MAG: hypothetical protein L0Y55_04210 [Anaerolineales bacterium]|nr:hypothetical protein [Anaerolineales bacterium]